VTGSSEVERDTLDVDVLIVGGGPAGLSAAIRLVTAQKEAGGEPLAIAVLEKAREQGAHMLSGAVLDPSTLDDLIPDWKEKGAPVDTPVTGDRIFFLTKKRRFRSPFTPPPLRNHGNYVVSLNRFVKWLAQHAESVGVDIFAGFAGAELLFEADRVIGVRTGDKGIDRDGQRKQNFEPGVDIKAKVTILADGVRGNLTKTLVERFSLDKGRVPQVYALGLKELWEVPPGRLSPGEVIHTLGYPLRSAEFGGGFVYALPDNRVAVGFVAGLDYRDPLFDPYATFQRFKQHPLVATLLTGGTMVRYGAKALPEGGWHAIPRCHVDGALIVGDAGGFLNSVRLKGIHLAMRSGMHAADAAVGALAAGTTSAAALARYRTLIETGPVRRELYPVRNVHQSFGGGLLAGVAYAGFSLLTGGWWFRDPMPSDAGHERIQTVASYGPQPAAIDEPVAVDRALSFDKLTSVHYSGTRHTEDQPSHLLVRDTDICRTRCLAEYQNPCLRFCPANVYEMVDADGADGVRLQVNASNCVHCKTCDIMDPYQIIDWVPPEGEGGPQYEGM
jgi:electron-transferring-flavoprotein dehydrogenase